MADAIGMGEDFLKQIAAYVAREQQGEMTDRSVKLGLVDYDYDPTDFLGGINPRILFDGESIVSQKRYTVIPPYYPKPGDRVALLPMGTTYAIIGTVGNVQLQPNVQVFTASDTWTKPVGARYVKIECQGGGGGGGGAGSTVAANTSCGAGGGGGAYASVTLTANVLGATEGVTVGAGGAGGVGNATGTAGSTSSFGSVLSAGGGNGGGSKPSGVTMQGSFGGNGGISFSGTGALLHSGTGGQTCWSNNGRGISGTGGASALGGGGAGQHTTGNQSFTGKVGEVYGGGGGGAIASDGGAAANGGAGAAGVVIVTTYFN